MGHVTPEWLKNKAKQLFDEALELNPTKVDYATMSINDQLDYREKLGKIGGRVEMLQDIANLLKIDNEDPKPKDTIQVSEQE